MPNTPAHFSINADDVARARQFYEVVFGWKFAAWGPPGFFMIEMDDKPARHQPAKLLGSLQGRRNIVPGVPIHGFECTLAVDDVDATAKAIEANGGKIVMPRITLPTVGHLLFFQDTEGNIVGAMQYDPQAG
jgi:predicted enzyme related to lactoylglutathione lyase